MYDVCGICNGLVDIFADLSQEQFDKLGFEKGTMRLVEAADQTAVLEELGNKDPVLQSGGSVANSVIAVAQLGGKGVITCNLSNDQYGQFYHDECIAMGIHMPVPLATSGATGTVLSLITPDAERTMRTALGASIELGAGHIDLKAVTASKWLFVEGYVFSNSDAGRAAIQAAVAAARGSTTKVAVTCSEAWVVHAFGEPLRKTLESAHLIFANEEEAAALSGSPDSMSAGRSLSAKFPHVVLTAGPRGAYMWWEGEEMHVPAFDCEPRDLTGAGDMFAGAFLYGITNGYSPSESARRACYLAREVITKVGARLSGDVKGLWALAQ